MTKTTLAVILVQADGTLAFLPILAAGFMPAPSLLPLTFISAACPVLPATRNEYRTGFIELEG
jgi:hypothetical protein